MAGVTGLVIWLVVRYAGSIRYPDGGGLDAAERAQALRAVQTLTDPRSVTETA
jgi:hypothetical protein